MNQPLIEPANNSPQAIANAFRTMADKIERNAADTFGGAVVIVPPGGGDPVHLLILDSQQDLAMFWGNLKAKCDIALATIDNVARNQGFARR